MFTAEQRRFCDAQPVQRVQHFASLIGWNDLRPDFWFDSELINQPNFPLGVVIFYRTTDKHFNFQVSSRFSEGSDRYAAFIVARRFGIYSVGPAEFTLFADEQQLQAEAIRLRSEFGRANFRNAAWRRHYAAEHPVQVLPLYRRRNKFLNALRRG